MASNDIDSNQHYEPLDLLRMKVRDKNGIETVVPAIHIGFMETRYYVNFKMPPQNHCKEDQLTAEEEEWQEYMFFLEEDLHWLLQLSHQRFWSQIVYDENLHRCLESYLSQAPREYDLNNLNLREELLSALKKVHKLVFLVLLRMSTYKESKKHHLTPEAFGNIIYDNYVFDIPKIMDICALYGIQNPSIVNKMVHNIFSTQPKYRNDLDETAKDILTKAFTGIEEQLISITNYHSNSTQANEADIYSNELLSYYDLLNYVTDLSFTLHAFLENYSAACEVFHQNGALMRIPTFYEQIFGTLENELSKSKDFENESIKEDIKKKLILSKTSIIRVFRNIFNFTCMQNILNYKMSNVDEKICANSLVENYFEIITELIFNKSFIHDYNILYPFESDLELFQEIGIKIDSDRANYIFNSIHNTEDFPTETFTSSAVNGARPKVRNPSENKCKPVQNMQDLADILRPRIQEENSHEEETISLPCGSSRPNDIQLDSLIQSVLDILSGYGYGEGFIEKCLEHFEYDQEKVIDALLTHNLPDSLNCLDQKMKRQPKNVVTESLSVLSERKSVFDNDEFDLFSRKDVNMENIHLGKKNKTPSTYQTLQNDEESEFLKQLTIVAASVEEEDENQHNIYEDEYDDTYDSTMVGLKEPALEDEPDLQEDTIDEVENKEEEENTRQPKPGDFCVDPQILRERAEQRRLARGGFSNRNNRGASKTADSSQNRQHKDRHKANVGNHNRKKQSDFKRSRGMVR